MLDREAFGEDAFQKEDQNNPQSAKDKPFKHLQYWGEWPEKLKKLKLAIDPSEGKGDSSAYIVGGEINGGVFIKDSKLALHNPYQIMDEVVRLVKEYPDIDEIVLESNLFKDLLKDELIKKLCENDCYRMVTHVKAVDNKEIRIMKLEPDITGGKILFNRLNVSFNEEVKDFSIKPKCKHDDAIDATQLLWKTLKKPNYYIK
jgi:predicted phage terminase large subunit-like protein